MLNKCVAFNDQEPDEVVKITIGNAFNIYINRSAINFQFWVADNMNFLFSNRKRFQCMMVFFFFVPQLFWPATRPERIRKLCYGEDAFTVVFFSLLFVHAG